MLCVVTQKIPNEVKEFLKTLTEFRSDTTWHLILFELFIENKSYYCF